MHFVLPIYTTAVFSHSPLILVLILAKQWSAEEHSAKATSEFFKAKKWTILEWILSRSTNLSTPIIF